MNRLTIEKQAQLVAALVEGNSLRGTGRWVKIRFNTVTRNLLWLGEACQKFHDTRAVNLTKCVRFEADELWAFIYAKDKNITPEMRATMGVIGSVWTWVALCPDTRFVISWHIGGHEPSDCETFMTDVAGRIPGRVQMSSDQLPHYRTAVENAFGDRVDYATIRKLLKPGEQKTPDGKYEQPAFDGLRKASVLGNPAPEYLSTGSIESFNLQIRMSGGRYLRSSNRFSRKLRNMKAALALNFAYYNYVRIHPAIKVTPAMEMGLTDRLWEIEDLIAQLNLKQLPQQPI